MKKTRELLTRAMNALPNSEKTREVRHHINVAIIKIDKLSKKENKKAQTHHQDWWKDVTAGVANAPMSHEAQVRNLEQLNRMIKKEQEIIEDSGEDILLSE